MKIKQRLTDFRDRFLGISLKLTIHQGCKRFLLLVNSIDLLTARNIKRPDLLGLPTSGPAALDLDGCLLGERYILGAKDRLFAPLAWLASAVPASKVFDSRRFCLSIGRIQNCSLNLGDSYLIDCNDFSIN
jgi:hypothetical protein